MLTKALLTAAGEEGFTELLQSTNFPGVILLGLAGIPAMFFLVRWMVRFQREFTDFYIQENHKLRDRVDSLEEEAQAKDSTIVTLNTQIGDLQNRVAAHERTIAHLERVMERRKLQE